MIEDVSSASGNSFSVRPNAARLEDVEILKQFVKHKT